MANVLKSEQREGVLALGRLGKSAREIERVLGVRRETAAAYLRAAGVLVRPPGWLPSKPAMEASTDQVASEPAMEASTGSGAVWPPPPKHTQASKCEEHRDLALNALRAGRHDTSIFQELVDQHGFTGSYKSVWRFATRLRKAEGLHAEEACGVILTGPGEEAQVDFGEGPLVRDAESGKYRRTRLFVLTLGHSRKAVWLLCWRSGAKQWCQLHAEAVRRLGGTPRLVVLDNLKEGVRHPDIYDPTVNVLYGQFLKHHGVEALPARVRDPDRKGKVERSVAHAQGALRGLKFERLEAAQTWLDQWAERWADTRIHGTTKRQVSTAFAEEKPFLQPLPVEPFRFFEQGHRKVHSLDGCVQVESAYYEAPPGMLGDDVLVQWDDHVVRLMCLKTGVLLVEHPRKPPGRHSLVFETGRRIPRGVSALLSDAVKAGPAIGTLCHTIHSREGVAGVRRIQGTLRLCVQHGVPAVEDACRLALDAGAPTYKLVKAIVRRQPEPALLKQVDPLIRELSRYRAVIEARLQGGVAP
jgi:transposase